MGEGIGYHLKVSGTIGYGDYFWEEQVLIPVGLAYDVDLAGLIPGQNYECQYILVDNGGNQTVTEWEQV